MNKKAINEEQNKLDDRITEIKAMSNKQLVGALQTEAEWHYAARRDMRAELAENTYKDMELLKLEILGRMIEPRKEYCACGFPQSSPIPHTHSL